MHKLNELIRNIYNMGKNPVSATQKQLNPSVTKKYVRHSETENIKFEPKGEKA